MMTSYLCKDSIGDEIKEDGFELTKNLRTSTDKIKENGFELTKKRSRRYPAKTITDVDYADDIVILANAPAQSRNPTA